MSIGHQPDHRLGPPSRVALAAVLLLATQAWSQNTPADALRANERAIREAQQRLQPEADVFTQDKALPQAPAEELSSDSTCVQGVEPVLLGHPEHWREEPLEVLSRHAGGCHGPRSLNRLLADLNSWYQAQGLITTRVYIESQKLQAGPLKLRVVPGTVQSIAINGNQQDPRIASAFALRDGDLLNLRDLEQGLENINRLPSQQGQFRLLPGDSNGTSRIEVDVAPRPTVRVTELIDNSGTPAMGRWKSTTELAVDNPTEHNDQLAVGLLHNLDRGDLQAVFQGLTLNYLRPHGKHLWLASASWIDTRFTLPGINTEYGLRTHSGKLSLGYEYLFMRDQVSKHSLMAGVDVTRQRTEVEGFEVPSQTRRLTVAHVGIKGKRFVGNQVYEWWGRMEQGLRSFNAQHSLPDGTDPQFRLLKLRLNGTWPLPDNNGLVRSVIYAQAAPANTPTLAQMYVGGRYDVRGYQQNSLYAPSGWYARNEYETAAWHAGHWRLNGYAGLDAGRVQKLASRPLSQQYLSGSVLGLRAEHGQVRADLGWAYALSRPSEFANESRNRLYAQLSITF